MEKIFSPLFPTLTSDSQLSTIGTVTSTEVPYYTDFYKYKAFDKTVALFGSNTSSTVAEEYFQVEFPDIKHVYKIVYELRRPWTEGAINVKVPIHIKVNGQWQLLDYVEKTVSNSIYATYTKTLNKNIDAIKIGADLNLKNHCVVVELQLYVR